MGLRSLTSRPHLPQMDFLRGYQPLSVHRRLNHPLGVAKEDMLPCTAYLYLIAQGFSVHHEHMWCFRLHRHDLSTCSSFRRTPSLSIVSRFPILCCLGVVGLLSGVSIAEVEQASDPKAFPTHSTLASVPRRATGVYLDSSGLHRGSSVLVGVSL